MDDTRDLLLRMLDDELEHLELAESQSDFHVVPQIIDRLATTTRDVSAALNRDDWLELIKTRVDPHPLIRKLEQDPYTHRARSKPRGYAGDAIMMDYCYFTTPPESASALGKAIFRSTTTSPNARSVIDRLGRMADWIDRTAARIKRPGVLSMACGHMREAGWSDGFRRRRIGRLIALDQDEESLGVVRTQYPHDELECVHAKVKALLTGEAAFSDLDLVYAAGLFDYLDDQAARELVRRAFGFLRCRGRLIIGNFLPGSYGSGYMEAFMNWHLIERTRQQIFSLADALDASRIRSMRYFQDDNQIIGYLVVTHR